MINHRPETANWLPDFHTQAVSVSSSRTWVLCMSDKCFYLWTISPTPAPASVMFFWSYSFLYKLGECSLCHMQLVRLGLYLLWLWLLFLPRNRTVEDGILPWGQGPMSSTMKMLVQSAEEGIVVLKIETRNLITWNSSNFAFLHTEYICRMLNFHA